MAYSFDFAALFWYHFKIIMVMERTRKMRNHEENGPNNIESKNITRESLELYIEGCEELALRLDTVIEKVTESGKRPVILIPSRGAVPIFLLARRFMNELRGDASYLADKNARYFPEGVFDYLEGEEPQKPETKTTADVILFPFTADVSSEVGDDETLARDLRNSCARSVVQITQGKNLGQYDYDWYKFLMNKLAKNPQDPSYLNPSEIVNELDSYESDEETQIILIDTVISGRAANDITNAFKAIGHTVLPILAVDSTKGVKLDNRRKAEIESTLRPFQVEDMLPPKGVFVEFPLITEDKGSALLGLVAMNFINFNETGAFHKINRKFNADMLPQSCIWSLPPQSTRDEYLGNFRNFIDTAWRTRSGEESERIPTDSEVEQLRAKSHALTSTHNAPYSDDLRSIINAPNITTKESSSHIISITLSEQTAKDWVQEFSGQVQ